MADRSKSHPTAARWAAPLLAAVTSLTPFWAANPLHAAETEFFAEPAWKPADADAVSRQLDNYLRSQPLPAAAQAKIRELWWQSGPEGDHPAPAQLDRLANCLAEADTRVAELVTFCALPASAGKLPEFGWLANSEPPPFVQYNMRLYYARWLAQNSYDDEAAAWLDGISPADVVAPEMLLFYRAVTSHRLVDADRADASVAELLQRSDEIPVRYQKLALLMQQDLAGLEDDSLDHISRRMADVRRRLELGRAGKTVQVVEDGVIASLDKMIKDLEDRAQQQQSQSSGGSGGSGGTPSGAPMPNGRVTDLKVPKPADPKDVGPGADWSKLPEKEREQALQDVGREFPSHYREVIEEYFRRLAAEESDEAP